MRLAWPCSPPSMGQRLRCVSVLTGVSPRCCWLHATAPMYGCTGLTGHARRPGHLLTPMAANFNPVPAALLELSHPNGDPRPVPTALALFAVNFVLVPCWCSDEERKSAALTILPRLASSPSAARRVTVPAANGCNRCAGACCVATASWRPACRRTSAAPARPAARAGAAPSGAQPGVWARRAGRTGIELERGTSTCRRAHRRQRRPSPHRRAVVRGGPAVCLPPCR